jgi:YidC/Oxa1 family membrane protein insertase
VDRKLLFVLFMTTVSVISIQYLLKRPDTAAPVSPGQGYRIPSSEVLYKPLEREVNFVDKQVSAQEQFVDVESDLWHVQLSNFGGIVSQTDYKKRKSKEGLALSPVQYQGTIKRENTAFLVALDENTPYVYELESKEELDDRVVVAFSADAHGSKITKRYTVFKNVYKIDLELEFAPRAAMTPRIFVPAPYLAEINEDAQTGVVFNSGSSKLERVSQSSEQDAFPAPVIFGSEDRYFAHMLVGDASNFVQRGYFKRGDTGQQIAILEGPQTEEKTNWSLSFYMGPKDLHDLAAVDNRLEGLLNFGYFPWLAKLLLQWLEYVYSYVKNYGFAIIILTILIRLPLLPLSLKGMAVMEKHQRYQRQINHIRMKYKSDMQMQHQEIMKFYKEHNLSPTGQFFGCMPLLIDIPIMIGLYNVLGNYMDLYQAPFVGWIVDLSAKDPYYVLPILMGVSMIWQQSLTPVGDEKQRMAMLVLPLIMMGLFANFAAGLVLYWLTKNLLMIGETYLRRRFIKA